MNAFFLLTILCLCACSSPAEPKRSSRNAVPLTKRGAADKPNSGAGAAVAPAKEQPAETFTRVSFLGPKTGWGFVKATSPYFAPDGKRLGTLAGGTLFKYSGVKPSSKNDMLVSTYLNGATWEGPCLLDCTAIAGYEGDPDAIDPALVRNLAAYFTLNGKVAERRAELTEAAFAANPHFEPAKLAQQAYQESLEKAAEMERRMNTLTGARKSKALEELRAFKYEQVRIKAKADREASAYKAWKEAHPQDPAKLAADPQLQALERERQAARAKVAELVPDPE